MKSGLYLLPRWFATAEQAACANSLALPTTKFSKVYLGFRFTLACLGALPESFSFFLVAAGAGAGSSPIFQDMAISFLETWRSTSSIRGRECSFIHSRKKRLGTSSSRRLVPLPDAFMGLNQVAMCWGLTWAETVERQLFQIASESIMHQGLRLSGEELSSDPYLLLP